MRRQFFDTNVLVYAFTIGDHRMPRAIDLLDIGGSISVQCLNEFATVTLRKLRFPWDKVEECLATIESLCEFAIPIDREIHRIGLRVAKDYRFSVYDGMMVAAALITDCDTLYSEDMHDGLVIDGRLRIVNPFAPDAVTA